MRRSSLLTWSISFCTLLLAPALVRGDVIHESAILGPTQQFFGYGLSDTQFLGSRFRIDDTVQVDAIGGHLSGSIPSGTLFGAIVSLTGQTALPSGSPFDLTTRGAVRIYALAGTKQEMSVKFWESLPYEKSKDIPYVRTFAE